MDCHEFVIKVKVVVNWTMIELVTVDQNNGIQDDCHNETEVFEEIDVAKKEVYKRNIFVFSFVFFFVFVEVNELGCVPHHTLIFALNATQVDIFQKCSFDVDVTLTFWKNREVNHV